MVKLKKNVPLEKLKEYGFEEKEYDYQLKIGALDLYCNKITRKITGFGFYPVGDRIVMREISDLGMSKFVSKK